MSLKFTKILGKTRLQQVLLTMLTLITLTASVFAAQPMLKISPEFMAGFAFYKFAKVTPDFESWIKASPRYKDASPRERVIMLRTETQMLEGRFNGYAPKENPITIKVRAKYVMPGAKTADKMLAKDGQIRVPMKIIGQKEDFFPIQVGDIWIAMIPGNLEEMMTLTFDKEDYATFRRQVQGMNLTGNAEATLHLSLLPTSANTNEPMQFEGFNLWMMGVRIIDLEIWDSKDQQMGWFVEGPGSEIRRNSDQIFNLYEN